MRVRVVLRLDSGNSAIILPVPTGSTIESLAGTIAARAQVPQVELYSASGERFYPEDNACDVLHDDEQIVAFDNLDTGARQQRQFLIAQAADHPRQATRPAPALHTHALGAGVVFVILMLLGVLLSREHILFGSSEHALVQNLTAAAAVPTGESDFSSGNSHAAMLMPTVAVVPTAAPALRSTATPTASLTHPVTSVAHAVASFFDDTPASTVNCGTRDLDLMARGLAAPAPQRKALAQACGVNKGKRGHLELCCSLHVYETSGYGNQLFQLAAAMRWVRANRCEVLCLPTCDKDCWATKKMWHGKGLGIGDVIDMPLQVKVPASLLLEPGDDVPPPSKSVVYHTVGCLSGGWPYCYFDNVQWAQAAADLQLLFGGFEPLPEDEVVVHVRSGDSILTMDWWITRDATNADFNENYITDNPVQPTCAFYTDLILTGYQGKPFRKVHLIADQHCKGDVKNDHGQYVKNVRGDGQCGSTNPCIAQIIKNLPKDTLVLAPNLTETEAFKRDCTLIARSVNLAVSCSTMTIFGRLTSNHLKRLFVPDCSVKFKLTRGEIRNGRRRTKRSDEPDGSQILLAQHRDPEFVIAGWVFLGTGVQTPKGDKYDARPFSIEEAGLTEVSFYEFDWHSSPLVQAAVGPRVFSMDEWKAMTNSSFGNPKVRLMMDVPFRKRVFGHVKRSPPDSLRKNLVLLSEHGYVAREGEPLSNSTLFTNKWSRTNATASINQSMSAFYFNYTKLLII